MCIDSKNLDTSHSLSMTEESPSHTKNPPSQIKNPRPLRIGYFADGIWSHNAFKKIISSKNYEFAFIMPRFCSTDSTLLDFAKSYKIPYIKAKNINDKEFLDKAKAFKCDIFVSMSFNQIFKEPLISLPRLKTINCHAGKLPFYRGRNVLNWALINDEKEFGITAHFVDSGIDTGDIILQKTYPISDSDDYTSLLNRAHIACADVLFEALELLRSGNAKPIRQDSIHSIGFYCPARIIGDEWISLDSTSRELFNFIRALNAPNLGAKALLKGKIITIYKAQIIKNAPIYKATNGAILGLLNNLQDLQDSKNSQNLQGLEDSANPQAGQDSKLPAFIIKTLDSTLLITHYHYDGKIRIGDRLENASSVRGGGDIILS